MKNKIFLLLAILIFDCAYSQHDIIPVPVYYETKNTHFLLDDQVELNLHTNDTQVIKHTEIFQLFLTSKGILLPITTTNKSKKTINISLLESPNIKLGNEGYLLDINENSIWLTANEAAGIFNGFQTLRQLIPIKIKDSSNNTRITISIKSCKIEDYPRFAWRGLMLDVSRHFFSVEDVKAFLDKMSQYKLNVFHWHLTDDQGWRIEIKSLPKLTEIGAWRVERQGRFGKSRIAPKPEEKSTYGGFYSQEQIKNIIKYAADRNITIVPEIDIPGHSMAALAAYPEFSTKKEPKYVSPGNKFSEWYGNGKFKMMIENTLNPSDEKVYEFIDKIFTEVAELFPGEYIHMGGDEAYHGYWDADLKVQKFMKNHNIKNSHELQSYFVKRVEKIINSKGKKMIGWDEILDGGLAKSATVMSWRGMKGGIEAAKMGHNVIMSPTTFSYLDYTQGDHSVENKIYADLRLEKVYNFEPVPEGIDSSYILGGQGNLWTEVIPNLPFAFYMTYPRAFALSETLWSPKEQKNWINFIDRTERHFKRFDSEQINISKAVLEPFINIYYSDNKLMCKLENSVSNTDLYYTIDNTYPVNYGIKYTEPFEIPEGNLNLRTQTFRNDKPLGRELIVHRADLVKRAKSKPFSILD